MKQMQLKPRYQMKSLRRSDNGELFKVTVFVPLTYGWIERMQIFLTFFGSISIQLLAHKENKNGYAIFEDELYLENRAFYNYYFSCECNGQYRTIKLDVESHKIIWGDNSASIQEMFKMSVGFEVPKWVEGENLYFIFPDRFYRGSDSPKLVPIGNRVLKTKDEKPQVGPNSNGDWCADFYGGDFRGVEEHLDYIKDLGMKIIYFAPIVEAVSNHRYDAGNYLHIDTYLGTKEDFVRLNKAIHKRDMRCILDAVFDHTGNDSLYFNEYGHYDTLGAFQSKDSPYYNYYRHIWTNEGSAFKFWWDQKNMPQCDCYSEGWIEFITGVGGVIDQWFEMGIDGLRLDVADELSDEFIELIRKAVQRNKPDGFILGEVWENAMRKNRGFLSSGKGMHSVMNYWLVDALVRYYKFTDINKLNDVINQIIYEYPDGSINTFMNFTSTHDISRIIGILGTDLFSPYNQWGWSLDNISFEIQKNHQMTKEEYNFGKTVLYSYVTGLAFFPGMFSIFYGDEYGAQGIGNLANRGNMLYYYEHRDEEVYQFYRTIAHIKNSLLFLKRAKFYLKTVTHSYYAYERTDFTHSIYVIVSRSHHWTDINLSELNIQTCEENVIFRVGDSNVTHLAPYGALILGANLGEYHIE